MATASSRAVTLMLTFQRRRLVYVLWGIMLLLVLASLTSQLLFNHLLGHDTVLGLLRRFNLRSELSIPTWFSSSLSLVNAFAVWIVASANRNHPLAGRWVLLGGLFLYLSVDEAAALHELLQNFFEAVLRAWGLGEYSGALLIYGWLLPASTAVVVVTAYFWRLIRSLPPPIGAFVLLAGAVYVSGAIGFDVIGDLVDQGASESITHTFIVTVEESLEMSGMIMFLSAMLAYQERLSPIQSSF